MADFQPVSEAELEGSPPPPAAQAPAAPASGPTQGYEPVNDNDLAPAAPMFQPNFRGPRGGIPNIPAAAAQRFKDSDAFNNIFQTAATRFANGFVNTFSALTVKDQQAMRDAGYGPGDFNSAGGALRWGAHVFGSTFNVLQDGFLALGPGIIEGVGGAAEQASRETGIGDPEMVGGAFKAGTESILADVGDMHAMSMVDAARAQAKVPGVYSQAFRVDQTPGGGIVHTPLGRLPTEAEAIPQSRVAADALHLPPDTADLIHQIYTETGRPPAETLMDAKTNNGGVLRDLVAGKVPEAYGGEPQAVSALPNVAPEDFRRLSQQASLEEQHGAIQAKIAALPEGDASAADRLNRLRAVEQQLADPNLAPDAAKKLSERRDQILVDTTPEALQEAAAPLEQRRALEAQRDSVAAQLADLSTNNLRQRTDARLGEIQAGDTAGTLRVFGQEEANANARIGADQPLAEATARHDNTGDFSGRGEPAGETGPTAPNAGADVAEQRGQVAGGVQENPGAGNRASEVSPKGGQGPQSVGRLPAPSAGPGISKIGKSIEAKAIEAGLTRGFADTAHYDSFTIKDQAERTANLINTDIDKARTVIRGEEPLPEGMRGTALVTAMEEYIKRNPSADLAGELANSPLVTATSHAAGEMRLAAERTPDSAAAALQQVRDAVVKKAGGAEKVAARIAAVKEAKSAANGILLPKEELSWARFLDSIKCP